MSGQSPAPTIVRPAAARRPLRRVPDRRHDGFRPPPRAGFSLPTVHEIPRPPVRDAAKW